MASLSAEKVPASDVLASVADGRARTRLTGPQWVAFAFAAGVFLVMVGATAFNFYTLDKASPPFPSPPKTISMADLEAYKVLVEQYREITQAAHERARNLFDTFVAASFLPLFAGIVGFIFGRERAG